MTSPDQTRHWAEHLAAQAKLRPHATAFEFVGAAASETRSLSFAQLHRRATACAHAWRSNVGPSQRVLLCLPPGADFMIALFGCFALGAVAVPVAPPLAAAPAPGQAWFAALVADAEPAAVVWSPTAAEQLAGCWPASGVALSVPASHEGRDDDGDAHPRSGEDLAIILYTSGSTGTPKGVEIRHESLLHNMREFARGCGRSSRDRIHTWLPNVHIAGLYTRLLGVYLGCPTLISGTSDFLQSPAGWLQTISDWRATISAAPNFAYDLAWHSAVGRSFDTLDLSTWDMAVTGGEVVRLATYERFVQRFAPHGFRAAAFHPYFGLTETLCTTIPQQGEGPRVMHVDRQALRDHRVRPCAPDSSDALTLLGNGAPLADDLVAIVDPETRRVCREATIGEIWTSAVGNTHGYWRRPELSQEICHARIASDDSDDTREYFRTGDLGFMHAGELFVTGRRKELIILHGKNYYPQDIEATVLETVAGATACAAFSIDDGHGEQLGVAVECGAQTPARQREIAARVRAAVQARHGASVGRLALLSEQRLPRTSTQKLQRGACRELLLAGAWAAADGPAPLDRHIPGSSPHAPTDGEWPAAIADYVCRALERRLGLEVESLTGDESLAGLGLDSVGLVELALAVREFCGPRLAVEVTDFYTDASIVTLAHTLARGRELDDERSAFAHDLRLIDAVLDEPGRASGRGEALLLTGATGFLGRYLLHALLCTSERELLCLVRAADVESAHARLRQALAAGPGYDEAWRARIVALPGDLTAPQLGLSAAAYSELCERVGVVVHNAANVDFVAPYSRLRASNVLPTLELVRLCRRAGDKPLHYVSTTAVFNSPERAEHQRVLESDRFGDPQQIYSGYAQSKWASEALLDAARARGLPVSIYRPAQVTGHAQTGDWNTDDFVCRFIAGCLQLGHYPALDVEVDMVPVDYVARAIALLALTGPARDYNLCQPRAMRLPALFAWYSAAGYACVGEPLREWLARLDGERRSGRANPLVPMLPFLQARPQPDGPTILELLDAEPSGRLDTSHTRAGLQAHELEPPAIDDALLRRYTEFLRTRGSFDAPPR